MAFTAVHQRALRQQQAGLACQATDPQAWLSGQTAVLANPGLTQPSAPTPSPALPIDQLRIYPDIALALLRTEQAAAGRIWLLLRHLDRDGRGWIGMAEARAALTGADSSLRVCGWRQLRNLLNRGEGLFWQRQAERRNGRADRLWLRSLARVAAALGVRRLTGRPVALSLKQLLAGIGAVRAHFYASFHSSRATQTAEQVAPPIARATLEQLSGVSRHSQRRYESQTGVRRRRNFAVCGPASATDEQERAWRHGQALFTFHDRRRQLGSPPRPLLAWQLPNSYAGPHAQQPRGRQKSVNRQLADLFMQGITGNDGQRVAPDDGRYRTRRFFRNGRVAGQAYNQAPEQDSYWPHHARPGCRRRGPAYQIWHLLPGRSG